MNLSLLIDLPKIENKNNKRSISFIVYEKVRIMVVEARQPKKIKHNCQWGPLAVLRPPWFKVLTNFLLYQGEWIKKTFRVEFGIHYYEVLCDITRAVILWLKERVENHGG